MKAQLQKKIDAFLAERRPSNGGWAEITNKDVIQLENIIQALIESKCQPDPDGDFPIEFVLVNRRNTQGLHYTPMSYGHKNGESLEQELKRAEDRLDTAMYNLSMASSDAQTAYKQLTTIKEQINEEQEQS